MYEYNTSSFGLNIGTGLMLESLLVPTEERIDVDRKIPSKVNIKEYDKYYINLQSFISNVIMSFDKEAIEDILKDKKPTYLEVKEKVLNELVLLDSMLTIDVVYYYSTYNKLYTNGILKPINKETKTGMISSIVNKMATELVDGEIDSIVIDYKLPITKKSLITTSNPIDLLISGKADIDLLEFHTGLLRHRNTFYTKLKCTEALPFVEILFYIITDKKGLLVSSVTTKEKKAIINLFVNDIKLKSWLKYERSFILNMIKSRLGIELYDKCSKLPVLF